MTKTQTRTQAPKTQATKTQAPAPANCPGSAKPWKRPPDALPSCPACGQISDELAKQGIRVLNGQKLAPRVPGHRPPDAAPAVTVAEMVRNLPAPAADARSLADASVLNGLVREPAPAAANGKAPGKAPSRSAKVPAPAPATGSTPARKDASTATTAPAKAAVAKAPAKAGEAAETPAKSKAAPAPAPAPAANGGSARRASHRELARRLAEAARDLFDGTDPEGEQRVATWLKFLPTGRREDGKRWWPEGFLLPETDAFGWDPADRDGR